MNNASSMSADVVSLCAYAKINIHLRVLARRNDGFHTIESIFQRISLADSLSVTKIDEQSGCIVESPLMSLPVENTLTRMWKVFKDAAEVSGGVKVRLLKNLPAGSGLGAGSSDAAAFLQAINSLFQQPFRVGELQALALQVGSDVPFFLAESAAVVTGRGELLKPLDARSDCYGIMIWPEIHSSTKEAYCLLDDQKIRGFIADETLGFESLEKQYRRPIDTWQFMNDFQIVLEQRYPVISRAAADLYQCGAVFARMSGSGSAVFGLFDTEDKAGAAFEALSNKWNWCKAFVLLA